MQSAVTHKIVVRYRSGVNASMRFSFDGRIFNIRAVIDVDEKRDTMAILVEEGWLLDGHTYTLRCFTQDAESKEQRVQMIVEMLRPVALEIQSAVA